MLQDGLLLLVPGVQFSLRDFALFRLHVCIHWQQVAIRTGEKPLGSSG